MPRRWRDHRGLAVGHARNLKAVHTEGRDLTCYLAWRSPPPPHLLLLGQNSQWDEGHWGSHSSRPPNLKVFPQSWPRGEMVESHI